MTSKAQWTESDLRHPLERAVFIGSVILNFVLMALALALVVHPPEWLKSHPILGKEASLLRAIALVALVGIPASVLLRNRRRAFIRGNSVRLSRTQFPEVYAILESHCQRLGMTRLPELYISDETIPQYSEAYSSWKDDYIVLHQILFDIDYTKTLDIVGFTIGHELGAIRLGHTAWWSNMLLTYVHAIKGLATPLRVVRVYSRDRYGAYLMPTGLRGLLIYAAGRRLIKDINIEDYFEQSRQYGDLWATIATFAGRRPQVLRRIQELNKIGLPLTLPPAP